MSWSVYHGEQQCWSWDLEHPMQRPQAVFIREADIRNEEKVCWKVGKLPKAEHSVNGDRLLVRPCTMFSPCWVFLHGTLLGFVETSWETDPAQGGTGISITLSNWEGMVLQSQLKKKKILISQTYFISHHRFIHSCFVISPLKTIHLHFSSM